MAAVDSEPDISHSSAARREVLLLRLRAATIVALHAGALFLLWKTEYTPFALGMSLAAWVFLNCLFLVVLVRPGISAALSLTLIAVLITLSRFKFEITQLTLTFLDFLIIDRDSFSFLLTIFPRLQNQIMIAAVVSVPLLWLVWRADPFRVKRKFAALGLSAATAVMAVAALFNPEHPWEPFQGVNHISNLARSGVVSVGRLTATGWIEAEPRGARALLTSGSQAHAAVGLPQRAEPCDTTIKRPHIIMLLDESSFDITAAPGIKTPANYADYFKSIDGKQRAFVAEATGGPTWYTEFNVLTGLSARSFGDLKFYVTRITAGRVERGLPQSLKRCGYKTFSLYPSYGNFLGARAFQKSTGVGHFMDVADMGAADEQLPDRFYFDQALKIFEREKPSKSPLFMFVYLTANHFPWTSPYRADLTPPEWKPPGNTAEVDEYLRRQAMTVNDYGAFVARLTREYPDEQFLVLRFGDHQPAISQKLMEPGIDQKALAQRLLSADPRYFATYYALDGINYQPRNLSSALPTLDAAYIPIVVQDAAGVPLDPSFAEQKKIMLRCNGVFYSCRDGAEARRFNRLLIDAGLIKTP
jgi:hypothetical protein